MFKLAERKKSKLKIAITGPSGSGKTYSALLIAKGMGGKIALIDSERGSASLYAKHDALPSFDVNELHQFEPEFYVRAIKEAVAANYDTLIIDSLSHEWSSTKLIAEASKKGENSWSGWATATPRHQALIDTILQSPIHIITTMRSKTSWTLEKDEKTGKNKPVKVGLEPDQRKDIDFEFTTIFYIDQNHVAIIDKDRTELFKDFNGIITEDIGQRFKVWLDQGIDNPEINKPTEERRKFVFVLLKELGLNYEDPIIKERLKAITLKESMTFWSQADTELVIAALELKIKETTKNIKIA